MYGVEREPQRTCLRTVRVAGPPRKEGERQEGDRGGSPGDPPCGRTGSTHGGNAESEDADDSCEDSQPPCCCPRGVSESLSCMEPRLSRESELSDLTEEQPEQSRQESQGRDQTDPSRQSDEPRPVLSSVDPRQDQPARTNRADRDQEQKEEQPP